MKEKTFYSSTNELCVFEEPGTIIGESGSFQITNNNPVSRWLSVLLHSLSHLTVFFYFS